MSAEQDLARALASVGGNFGKRNARDANRAYYQKLLAAGSDTSPVQHWAQGLARITQGLTGGWMAGEERRKEEAGGAAIAEAAKSGNFESLAAALAGAGDTGTAAQVAIANAMYGRSKQKEAETEEGRRRMIEALTGGPPGAGAGGAAGRVVPLPGAQPAPGGTGTPEGFNYNFGNIRAGQPWQGATGQYNGFTTFDTPENGVRAMIKNLQAYASSGQPLTIATIGAKWAPPSENNTPAWVKNVATAAGLPPDAPINPNDPAQMAALARGIATAEKGNAPPMEVIQRGIALAFGQTPQPAPSGQPGALPQQTAAMPPPVAAQAPPAATAPTPAATPGTPPAAPPALPGGLPAPPELPPGAPAFAAGAPPPSMPGSPAGTPEEMLAAALAAQPQPGALPPPSFGAPPARMAGGQLRFGPGSAPAAAPPPQAAEAALAQALLPRSATAAEGAPMPQPGADVPMPSPIVRTQANAPAQPPAPPQAPPMQPPAPTAPPPQAQQQPNPYAAQARDMEAQAAAMRARVNNAAQFAKTPEDFATIQRAHTQAQQMEQQARTLALEAQKFDIARQDRQTPAPPAGYRMTPDGRMEAIAGGPADPEIAKRMAEAKRAENEKAIPTSALGGMQANYAALRSVDRALTMLKERPEGVGWKFMLQPEALATRTDPDGVKLRALIADIGSLKIHDRSGAAVSAAEFPRLKPFIPSVGDDPKTVADKLTNFRIVYDEMLRDSQEYYSRANGFKPYEPAATGAPLETPPAAAPTGAPVKITGAEDYGRLPPGTQYMAPDGSIRVKK